MKLPNLTVHVKSLQPFPSIYCQSIKELIKRVTVFLFAWLSATACNKNSETLGNLEGKWQLSAMFLQTSGPGSWHLEDSIPPNFIRFNHDGSLIMSAYVSSLYNGPVGYQVTSKTTMVFNYPNGGNNLFGENVMHFQFTDTVLTITPPSMEYVEEKYVRVQ
jgi:hypothetical protein